MHTHNVKGVTHNTMNNVISFRAKRYAQMEAMDVFFEILSKEHIDTEDEMFLDIAIQQLGLSSEDLFELANQAVERANQLLNS